MITKKSGRWGRAANIPLSILEDGEELKKDNGVDWTISRFGDKKYLIAKLYDDPKHFNVVICEILKED